MLPATGEDCSSYRAMRSCGLGSHRAPRSPPPSLPRPQCKCQPSAKDRSLWKQFWPGTPWESFRPCDVHSKTSILNVARFQTLRTLIPKGTECLIYTCALHLQLSAINPKIPRRIANGCLQAPATPGGPLENLAAAFSGPHA